MFESPLNISPIDLNSNQPPLHESALPTPAEMPNAGKEGIVDSCHSALDELFVALNHLATQVDHDTIKRVHRTALDLRGQRVANGITPEHFLRVSMYADEPNLIHIVTDDPAVELPERDQIFARFSPEMLKTPAEKEAMLAKLSSELEAIKGERTDDDGYWDKIRRDLTREIEAIQNNETGYVTYHRLRYHKGEPRIDYQSPRGQEVLANNVAEFALRHTTDSYAREQLPNLLREQLTQEDIFTALVGSIPINDDLVIESMRPVIEFNEEQRAMQSESPTHHD